jgi:hypothetical protein
VELYDHRVLTSIAHLQLTVLSGILDVVTFVQYQVFVSKQTGRSGPYIPMLLLAY